MIDEFTIVTGDDGLKWVHRFAAHTHDDTLAFGIHEGKLRSTFDLLWKECDERKRAFLDIGAHVGRYSIRAAARGLNVIAVEANDETADVLRRNVVENHFEDRVWVYNCAAWDRPATLYWNQCAQFLMASGRVSPDHEGQVIHGMPTDDLCGNQRIAAVKIDTEGAEGHVLRGMTRILTDDRPTMLIEMHDRFFDDGERIRDDVFGTLEARGYWFRSILDIGSQDYVLATPTRRAL